MSSLLETIGPRAGESPLTYTLTELGTVDLQAAFAIFDGTGASGSFRPALTIRAQNGAMIAQVFPTDELAVGDVAAVTYAPFLRSAGGGSGGSGIQFDTTPQESAPGGFLEATTLGGGMVLKDSDGGTVSVISEDGAGGGFLNLASDGEVSIRSANTTNYTDTWFLYAPGGQERGRFDTDDRYYQLRLQNESYSQFTIRNAASVDLLEVNGQGDTKVRLAAGKALTVFDSADNPIFRVDESGDLHGKTGKALTFDL